MCHYHIADSCGAMLCRARVHWCTLARSSLGNPTHALREELYAGRLQLLPDTPEGRGPPVCP